MSLTGIENVAESAMFKSTNNIDKEPESEKHYPKCIYKNVGTFMNQS